jgi:hypothetical protein
MEKENPSNPQSHHTLLIPNMHTMFSVKNLTCAMTDNMFIKTDLMHKITMERTQVQGIQVRVHPGKFTCFCDFLVEVD